MLNRLSKYQQEIAIYFMALFIIGGIIPLKASAGNSYGYPYGYNGGSGYHASTKAKSLKSTIPQGYVTPINKLAKPKSGSELLKKFTLKNKQQFNKFYNENNLNNKPFIGGPGQPEMGAFKPVGADNMVDLFSGDMSYNIPLLDVGGYPVNIFYNSGITMDQEASWAGLGWNINPGTIMRNMRGVPDDFNGTDMVTKTLSMKDDKTWGVGVAGSLEIVGFPIGFGGNFGLNFNNQRGVSTELGLSANASTKIAKFGSDDKTANLSVSAGLNLSSQGGATFTPSISLSLKDNDKAGTTTSGSLSSSVGYNSRVGYQSLHLDAEVSKSKTTDKFYVNAASKDPNVGDAQVRSSSASVVSSNISFAYPSVTPSIRARMSRLNISASVKIGTELFYINPSGSLSGFYSNSRIAPEDKVTLNPAYGVMFYQNGNEDPDALLDFNRLQDGVFTKNNPTIAIPTYSYDVFSISGEGVGGSFRAYRGDLGYVHDAKVATRDDAGKVGFDIGLGPLAGKGGVNLEYVYSPTVAGSWEQGNFAKNMLSFKKSKEAYQAVYFKNPGEKTIPDIEFQKAVGDENLVRLKMAGYGTGNTTLLSTLEQFDRYKKRLPDNDIPLESKNVIKNRRDKRTQIITCLNAEEASRVGFDSTINSYDPSIAGAPPVIFGNCGTGVKKIKRNSQAPEFTGTDNYRKAHHISEIDVLGGDGRKYVYGIPVYNTKQIDATFNIENGNNITMQSNYNSGVDDGLGNQKNKDWFIEKEEMPAYTHSFLLTELVSPNYVDLTGDGISEDDMGDAVKFNYSQMQPIKWRTPTSENKASYSEGLKTYNQDDKGHYTYGEREQWYLYSVESKNMVARFYVENDRRDGRQVKGIQGGLDASYGAQRLSKISLYSKGDLVKLGANAKPIKTVHLEYDYSLCPNTPNNSGIAQNVTVGNTTVNLNANKGKLTLRSIYFTYNGNERSKKNKYTFHYPSDKNPSYQYTSNDRWGNYKPAVADPIDGGLPNNLGGLSNADFPYSIQDKAKADKYAGAWVMDSIGLPSGGKIKIDYETDDYAYVQDRRAASMFQIAGFGATTTPTDAQFTYNNLYEVGGDEYEYIYAQIPTPISTTQSSTSQLNELQSKYFSNYPNVSKQIMIKLTLPMESTGYGYIGGNEMVAMYVDVEDFGLIKPPVGQTTSNKIYIKVKKLETHTPMVQYALQFTKNSLPGVAFPGSVGDNGIVAVVKALAAMIGSFKELLNGVDNVLKGRGLCRSIVMEKSFVRLSNPYFNKYGGGLRVKKVTISDNWDKMTGQAKSTYGQEYKYTKQELINGKLETISSGVASWEPAIGGEENPHREMMTYYNHNKGGPFDYNSVELPLAEMFFPSANVGYSHVEVLPLHRDTVKNAVGKSTTDFFTTRDFPTKSDNTFLEDVADGGANFYESPKVLQILNITNRKSFALSQGFKVDLNDMNGKVQRQESIGANGARISYTENYYNTTKATDQTFKFNHYFPTVNSPNGKIEKSLLGRDIEVMTDLRNHNSQTISANININIDVQVFGIFPVVLPPIFSPVFFEENDYKSASMLKVINHFGMLDSTVVIDKGSQVSTKNLLYDAETGNVLLTRTNNEYDKPIYNFTYPAHWAYSGMGPAYQNIDVIYENLTFRNGIIENPIQPGQEIDFKNFESGDELYVYSPLKNGPLLTSCDQGLCALPKSKANRIWAINTNKTGGTDNKFAFMDAQGNPYNAMQVSMRIIRSGHRNMLEQMVGGITSLQNPIVNNQLVFNDATGIIQTSAATFKDHWRVDGTNCNKSYEICPIVTQNVANTTNTTNAINTPTSTALVPSNDEPCDAEMITAIPFGFFNQFSTNVGASNSAADGIPTPTCGTYEGGDVWFKVVVPAGSTYLDIITEFSPGQTMTNGALAAYTVTGSCPSLTLTQIGCNDNDGTNLMPRLTLTTVVPGSIIYIRMWGVGGNVGSFNIGVYSDAVIIPTNDEPCNAITINTAAACNFQNFTNINATNSSTIGIPDPSCGNFIDADVWFKTTVPAGATSIVIDTKSINMVNGAMAVYTSTGNCPTFNMTELACSDYGSTYGGMPKITLNQPAGTVIYIRMWGSAGERAYFGVCITANMPPSNDECNAAETLTVNPTLTCNTSTNGTTALSTGSINVPVPTCVPTNSWNDDVWYKFTATSTSHLVKLSALLGGVLPQMGIIAYSGTCAGFTQIACTSADNLLLNSLVSGQIYYIRVFTAAIDNSTTPFNICLSTIQPITNDNCSAAVTLPISSGIGGGNYGTIGHTYGATPSTTMPVPELPNCGRTNGWDDDVWYKFTCTAAQQVITLSNVVGNAGMGMSLYSGYCGGGNTVSAPPPLHLICCDTTNVMNVNNLTIGQTYFIRVYTNAVSTGSITYGANFQIAVQAAAPPVNDECVSARILTVYTKVCSKGDGEQGTTYGATQSANTPNPTCGTPNGWDDDVWYKFVATGENQRVNFDYADVGIEPMSFALYSGTCSNLVLKECGTNVLFQNLLGLTTGATYYIRVFTDAINRDCNRVNKYFNICVTKLCEYNSDSSNFKNPYVEGVFGNWRADSTYSYYGTRKETDPSIAVDIRTGGTITGYKDFWNFNPNTNNEAKFFLKRNYTANKEWAWNSTSTQFNKKGYETENKDPLGRFNAGVYGYNQQLPIAVANNARLREVMYDGFEDYDYKTQASCNQAGLDCAIPARHAIFKDVTSANLSSQEHHTGRYSLKVAANTSVLLGAEVKNKTVADATYGFNVNVSSKQCPDTKVLPQGKGYTLTGNLGGASAQNINVRGIVGKKKKDGWIRWEGYLLPTSTGSYDFRTENTDDDIRLTISDNTNPTPPNTMIHTDTYGSPLSVHQNFQMIKGRAYRIVFELTNGRGSDYVAALKWKTPDMKCAGLDYAFIPTNQVYDNNSLELLQSHVTPEARTVYSLDQSQASGNKFNDKFSPLQGTKMVLSAWVKESTDCKCSTYVNNAIDLNIDGTITILKPTGNIIEGWQRYEAYFDIPTNGQNMSISLKNTGTSGDVFFDDVRIHPFNANEKTFVYHSSNLRLMAELDENNYASFYEYDDDGTLTRVKKETQRGVKTITETRSALYKQTQ